MLRQAEAVVQGLQRGVCEGISRVSFFFLIFFPCTFCIFFVSLSTAAGSRGVRIFVVRLSAYGWTLQPVRRCGRKLMPRGSRLNRISRVCLRTVSSRVSVGLGEECCSFFRHPPLPPATSLCPGAPHQRGVKDVDTRWGYSCCAHAFHAWG